MPVIYTCVSRVTIMKIMNACAVAREGCDMDDTISERTVTEKGDGNWRKAHAK